MHPTTFTNPQSNMNLAVAFGYLERLLYIGDSGKFYEEEARLRSLSNVLNQAGFEPYLYEDDSRPFGPVTVPDGGL